MKHKNIFILILLISTLILLGCVQPTSSPNVFTKVDGTVCKEDNKPIVRMFSTTTCPHCKWVGPTFDEVVKKYASEGKIIAHHWEWGFDDKGAIFGDDKLTPNFEGTVPASEEAIFNQFSKESEVPAFVIGCKYYRIGNEFEKQNDLNAERTEFVRIIEEVLKEN